MPTIKEIAAASGVSVATVSNIINNKGKVGEETRKRVLNVIKDMNYTPNLVAQNLKTKNTRSIGVIAEDMTVFAMPDIIDGITEYCEREGYQILLVNLRLYKKYGDTFYYDSIHKDAVEREIQKLLSKQVEGIIYVASHERLIDVIPKDISVPIVVAYGYTDNPAVPSIVVEDKGATEELVKTIIGKGHKTIGVVAGKPNSKHTQARLEGYQKALFENDLLYNPSLVTYGDWNRQSGYDLTEALLERGATAIFAMNDIMAGGVYDKLQELSITPGKEISVAGFDNREIATFVKPELTTVALPLHDIGYKAGDIILKMLTKEEISQDGVYYVNCTPFIRDSLGPCKA